MLDTFIWPTYSTGADELIRIFARTQSQLNLDEAVYGCDMDHKWSFSHVQAESEMSHKFYVAFEPLLAHISSLKKT